MDCFIVSKLMKTYLLFLAQSLFPVWRLSDSDMYDRKLVILTNFTTTLQTIAKLDTFIYLLGKSMFLLVCWLLLYIMLDLLGISSQPSDETSWEQGLDKGAILCFRNLYFYYWHGESTSTVSQLTSPASQKSKDLNKVPLLLQDLAKHKLTH